MLAWQEEWSHAPRRPPRLPHVRSSASRAPPTPRARGAGSACSSDDPGCGEGESLSVSPPPGWVTRTRSTPSPTSPPPRAPAGSAPWSPLVMSTRRRSTTWSSSSSRTRFLPPQWQIYLDKKTCMMCLPGYSLRLWSLFVWVIVPIRISRSLIYWRPHQSFNVKRSLTTGSVLCGNHKVCEIPQIVHCMPMVTLEADGKFVSCLNFHRFWLVNEISPQKTL